MVLGALFIVEVGGVWLVRMWREMDAGGVLEYRFLVRAEGVGIEACRRCDPRRDHDIDLPNQRACKFP